MTSALESASPFLTPGLSLLKPEMLRAMSGGLAWSLKTALLADIIEAVEIVEKRWRGTRLTPQKKARFIATTYGLLWRMPAIDRTALMQHVHAGRPLADLESSAL